MHILVLSAILESASRPIEIRPEHYVIHAAGVDAEEAGWWLDRLHRQLGKFFCQNRRGRLRVARFSDSTQFCDALVRNGHASTCQPLKLVKKLSTAACLAMKRLDGLEGAAQR